jgi:hypothetical protein
VRGGNSALLLRLGFVWVTTMMSSDEYSDHISFRGRVQRGGVVQEEGG